MAASDFIGRVFRLASPMPGEALAALLGDYVVSAEWNGCIFAEKASEDLLYLL